MRTGTYETVRGACAVRTSGRSTKTFFQQHRNREAISHELCLNATHTATHRAKTQVDACIVLHVACKTIKLTLAKSKVPQGFTVFF